MPRSALFVPITASRFLALAAVGGDDDMFSSDFSDEEFRCKLQHVSCPVGVVYGTADEYVPATVDLKSLGKRIISSFSSLSTSSLLLIEGGTHSLSRDAIVISEFVSFAVSTILKHE